MQEEHLKFYYSKIRNAEISIWMVFTFEEAISLSMMACHMVPFLMLSSIVTEKIKITQKLQLY